MPFFDMPLEELQNYKPTRTEPGDFDEFWNSTLNETQSYPLNAQFDAVNFGLKMVESYDVTFNGFNGQPIKGWFTVPTWAKPPLPCVVEFIGYGGGRGFPIDWLLWPSAGYAHLVMDTRGQGSTWRNGDTPDIATGDNPSIPGFMTKGILDPKTYYYRRVFADAVRAVQVVRENVAVEPDKIAVTGGSQGGGIALAVSGLVPEIPVSMPDVPFLSHFSRAIGLTDADPYGEITRYLNTHRDKEDLVFKTLAYFDGMNFAARAKAKTLFSTALMDTVCPPSTVFAAYNHINAEKDIKVYRFNQHEGGGNYHAVEKIKFLNAMWQ